MEWLTSSWVPALTAIGLGGLLLYLLLPLLRSAGPSNLPPGEVSFLQSFQMASDIPALFRKLRADPRPVFKVRLMGKEMAVINDADVARSLLSKDGDAVAALWPPTTQELLGPQSFSVTHGPYHRHIRKLLAQGFSSQAIESYLPQIQELAEKRLALWGKEGRILMHNQARLLTFEVMAVVVAGCQFEEQEVQQLSRHFNTFVQGCFFVAHVNLPWTAFGKAKRARAAIVAAIEEQIKRGAGQPVAEGGNGYLLQKVAASTDETGERALSRQAVQDVLVALLFAGHETTATTLTLLVLLLLDRHDVWERLREEQRRVMAAKGETITGEALREMTYLDAVVKEVWRWHPIAGTVPRVMLRDAEVGGFTIPKGWPIAVNLETMIRADGAQRWGTGEGVGAEDFNPDRWLSLQGGGVGVLPAANAFVFGVGGRSCIGAPLAWAELKVILALLARKFQVANGLDHTPSWVAAPLSFEAQLPVDITPLDA